MANVSNSIIDRSCSGGGSFTASGHLLSSGVYHLILFGHVSRFKRKLFYLQVAIVTKDTIPTREGGPYQ